MMFSADVPRRTALQLAVWASLWLAKPAAAGPITYYGPLVNGGGMQLGQIDSAPGEASDPLRAQFWSFQGQSGEEVSIVVHRLETDFDPALILYAGVFADLDDFSGDLFSIPWIDTGDDEINNPGPYGDPRIVAVLPAAGLYTLAVVNLLSDSDDGGDGLFDYQIQIVPEPGAMTLTLCGAAAISLLLLHRQFRRLQDRQV